MMHKVLLTSLLAATAAITTLSVDAKPPGLEPAAKKELRKAGVNKYVGKFTPAGKPESMGGWNKYTYDSEGGNGPICIDGSDFTVFHEQKAAKDVLIVLDGGGACVQNSYQCSLTANSTAPTGGIFDDGFDAVGIDNPFENYSKVFISYCDGSVFTGDNEVVDPNFALATGAETDRRYHRGLRNLTAGLDLARDLHPNAKRVVLSGISAGGYGVSAFAPSVYRFVFPPAADLFVLNDSGPSLSSPTFGAVQQDFDWQFAQFYPKSCGDCDVVPGSDQGAFIKWTLENDNGYKGALYSTDGDIVIRGFTFLSDPADYRDLLLGVHEPINAMYPDRYKLFIRGDAQEHTVLGNPGFYFFQADGVPFYQWASEFVEGGDGWVNIVEAGANP
ncbi:MAG: hypothetical protein ACI8RN_002270 [Glaciecola sp.]|jgi:hypothetical protein